MKIYKIYEGNLQHFVKINTPEGYDRDQIRTAIFKSWFGRAPQSYNELVHSVVELDAVHISDDVIKWHLDR